MFNNAFFEKPRILLIPIAANVPIIVATIEEIIATNNVYFNALIILSFWNNSIYQFKVNPFHLPIDLESLKEKTIKVTIGRYRKIKIKIK